MPYIGRSEKFGVRNRFYYTQASGGATSISGADDAGKTLTFTDGAYVDVFLNGIALVAGTDYNTTTADTIAGLSALSGGDIIEVLVYDVFNVADTVSASSGGTFSGAITANSGLNVGTIKEATGTTDAISIDSSGRVEIKQNSTATSNYATSGAWVISGVPDWADKIKFVGYRLSADTQGDTYFRVTVGGTAVIGTAYKHTQVVFNNAAAVATYDRSAGHGQIEIEGFAATANLFNWIVEIYKIDTNIYGFTANVANHTYGTYYVIQAGTIETSGAIDGVQLIASAGNFDSGKARLFWG